MQSIKRKADSQEIDAFLDELESKPWLKNGPRHWWPKFLFFFSDIRNIVKILESGKLLSRNEAECRKVIIVDSASHEILDNTEATLKDYVRLYFGPRTPTQYRCEGMWPADKQQMGAHCPVPVFLLFDSKTALTRSDCEFSNGNIASSWAVKGNDAKFLRSLPFRKIYHRGAYNPETHQDIKFHRHAEVLIPKELDLSYLRFIFCRSPAEKDSFLHLLPATLRRKWKKKIFVQGKENLFEKHWTFVERVALSPDRVVFHFSPDTNTPGPFEAELTLLDLDSGVSRSELVSNFHANGSVTKNFSETLKSYEVRLELDGNPAYASRFVIDDTPL